KNVPLPSGMYNMRGVAANAATAKLYIAFHDKPANDYGVGGLLCLDLNTEKVLWIKRYSMAVVPSPDRFDLTPDGKTIYMSVGENGPDDFWQVIDASSGNALGKIHNVTAPHN